MRLPNMLYVYIICFAGLLIYLTAKDDRNKHVGDVLFWTTFLVMMFHFGGVTIGH